MRTLEGGFNRLVAATVLGLLAGGACSDPVSVESDILIARFTQGRLELTNISRQPVYYFAADRDALAVADWIPCVDPDECEAVAPGSTRTVAGRDIAFFTDDTRVIAVYHWHLVPGGGATGYQPDVLRQLVMEVR